MSAAFRDDREIDASQLVALYDSVGWSAYTDEPDLLQRAVAASLRVVTAWDEGRLIGLARVVGDGLTMVYLQDILVVPDLHRTGLGRELMGRVMEPFDGVRQKFLVTDGTEQQRGFYTSMGFTDARDLKTPLVMYTQLK